MGRVDVLVNCAGLTVDRQFIDKPREEWEREIAIDVWGFINCVRAVLDKMVERRYGRIVSIGSDAGRMGEWREAVYSGTKASVIAMSKAIAGEVGKKATKAYPLRRLGTAEDVVPAVLLLASDRASYITGQTLSVSGGYTMI